MVSVNHFWKRRTVVSVAVLVCTLAGVAWAVTATVSIPSGQSGGSQSGTKTYTVNVKIEDWSSGDPTFRDLHIYPRGGKQINVDTGTSPTGQGWQGPKKAANGGVAFTSDHTDNQNGDYSFTVEATQSGGEVIDGETCDVVVTSSGKAKRQAGDQIPGGTGTCFAPTSIKGIVAPSPGGAFGWGGSFEISINSTTTFDLTLMDANASYQVYHSIVSLEDWSDAQGLGIQASTDPVPGSWGLTYTNLTGTLSSGEASFTITVPNDLSLAGKTFYLVGALKDSGSIIAKTHDVTVTIVP